MAALDRYINPSKVSALENPSTRANSVITKGPILKSTRPEGMSRLARTIPAITAKVEIKEKRFPLIHVQKINRMRNISFTTIPFWSKKNIAIAAPRTAATQGSIYSS